MTPLSSEEFAQLHSLWLRSHLSQAETGAVHDGVQSESEWGVVTSAAMTDASKRRQEESPERNVRAVSYQGGMSQGEVPVPKSSMPMMPLMVP